ncbi:unnamed protein product [Rhizophagus irregularis]|nr:unnamed protein product [Rhizophagus irregularis]
MGTSDGKVRLQCLHGSLPYSRFRPTCMFLNRWYWDKVWGSIPHRTQLLVGDPWWYGSHYATTNSVKVQELDWIGLHLGVLVCTVRPHISTKSLDVLPTFPMRPLVGSVSCLGGHFYTTGFGLLLGSRPTKTFPAEGVGIRYGVRFLTALGPWLVILGGMVPLYGDPGVSLRSSCPDGPYCD